MCLDRDSNIAHVQTASTVDDVGDVTDVRSHPNGYLAHAQQPQPDLMDSDALTDLMDSDAVHEPVIDDRPSNDRAALSRLAECSHVLRAHILKANIYLH